MASEQASARKPNRSSFQRFVYRNGHEVCGAYSAIPQIRRLKEEELNLIFDNAFLDREQTEVVALTESSLLDVDRGEVLRNSRYIHTFEF